MFFLFLGNPSGTCTCISFHSLKGTFSRGDSSRGLRNYLASSACFISVDNEAMVHVVNTRSSKVPVLMHLLPALLLSAARFSFSFSATHVPGAQNQIADAISRFRWHEFWCLAPHAHLQPLSPKYFWIS